jgi:hypothetical protein
MMMEACERSRNECQDDRRKPSTEEEDLILVQQPDKEDDSHNDKSSTFLWTTLRFMTAAALCWSAVQMIQTNRSSSTAFTPRRRLTEDTVPDYMEPVLADLRAREKLFEDTPPEEIKYWFEYTGPLQVRGWNMWLCFFTREWVGGYQTKYMHSSSQDQSHPLLEDTQNRYF